MADTVRLYGVIDFGVHVSPHNPCFTSYNFFLNTMIITILSADGPDPEQDESSPQPAILFP